MRKEVISFEDPTDENWKSTEIKTNKKKKKNCNQKRNQRKLTFTERFYPEKTPKYFSVIHRIFNHTWTRFKLIHSYWINSLTKQPHYDVVLSRTGSLINYPNRFRRRKATYNEVFKCFKSLGNQCSTEYGNIPVLTFFLIYATTLYNQVSKKLIKYLSHKTLARSLSSLKKKPLGWYYKLKNVNNFLMSLSTSFQSSAFPLWHHHHRGKAFLLCMMNSDGWVL